MRNEKYKYLLIKPAASALCKIMGLRANRPLPYWSQLLVSIKDLCANVDRFETLNADDKFLKFSALAVVAIDDVEMKDQFLCDILSPIINSFKMTLTPTQVDEEQHLEHQGRILYILEGIQSDLHDTKYNIPQLITFNALVETELWPSISKLLEIEALKRHHTRLTSDTIECMLRCIKRDQIIEKVAETMIRLYKLNPKNSSLLRNCAILVDEFAATSVEIDRCLVAMFKDVCTSIEACPETIDEVMQFFHSFLKKYPNEFASSKEFKPAVELSISSFKDFNVSSDRFVTKFFESFIELGRNPDHPLINEAIKSVYGVRIADAASKSCLTVSSFASFDGSAKILVALSNFDEDLYSKWVEASLATFPNTNALGYEFVTAEQLYEFKAAISAANSLQDKIAHLKNMARLYS
jgi:hypothetical protein